MSETSLLVQVGDVWIDPLRVVGLGQTGDGGITIAVFVEDYGVRDYWAHGIETDEAARIINRAREAHMGTR